MLNITQVFLVVEDSLITAARLVVHVAQGPNLTLRLDLHFMGLDLEGYTIILENLIAL